MKNYLRKKLRPFAQILDSQNSKGKYESMKILGFTRKILENLIYFFEIVEFLLVFISVFHYFECFILFWNFEFFFGNFVFLINN
jgi:hypothetical protein